MRRQKTEHLFFIFDVKEVVDAWKYKLKKLMIVLFLFFFLIKSFNLS